MSASPEKTTILTTRVRVLPRFDNAFVDWQAKFNAIFAAFPGFVSLEMVSPSRSAQSEWVIIQRFYGAEHVLSWSESQERKELIDELKTFLSSEKSDALQEEITASELVQSGVTEVFCTKISPDKDRAFQKWLAKIHQVESKFSGFLGVYVQSSGSGRGKNWITLLQFDTQENLDHWLSSPERRLALNELQPLITAIESHRIISPYAGWFSSFAGTSDVPSAWKQTMVILLVLFPIVMLEFKFLFSPFG